MGDVESNFLAKVNPWKEMKNKDIFVTFVDIEKTFDFSNFWGEMQNFRDFVGSLYKDEAVVVICVRMVAPFTFRNI